jgi:hypothetical protein
MRRGKERSRMQQSEPTRRRTAPREAPDGHGGLPAANPTLPAWESFAVAERHQVVRLLIQVARRQVLGQPPPGCPTGQGR